MQYTPDSIENKIRAIVARNLKIDAEKVGRDVRLLEDLGADSLDALSIAMDIDREFGIKVDDNEISLFRTCGEIASAVSRHLEVHTATAGARSA